MIMAECLITPPRFLKLMFMIILTILDIIYTTIILGQLTLHPGLPETLEIRWFETFVLKKKKKKKKSTYNFIVTIIYKNVDFQLVPSLFLSLSIILTPIKYLRSNDVKNNNNSNQHRPRYNTTL